MVARTRSEIVKNPRTITIFQNNPKSTGTKATNQQNPQRKQRRKRRETTKAPAGKGVKGWRGGEASSHHHPPGLHWSKASLDLKGKKVNKGERRSCGCGESTEKKSDFQREIECIN
jgi:hypothetical protein